MRDRRSRVYAQAHKDTKPLQGTSPVLEWFKKKKKNCSIFNKIKSIKLQKWAAGMSNQLSSILNKKSLLNIIILL